MRRMQTTGKRTHQVATTWRGWGAHSDNVLTVTSSPLAAHGPVKSRLAPKIRSWITLGAPLELMSPLSILRILFFIGCLFWPIVGLAWRGDATSVFVITSAGILVLACWVLLITIRSVSQRGSCVFGLLWIGNVTCAAWLGHGNALTTSAVTLLVPGIVFVALYLEFKATLAYVVLAVMALGLVLEPSVGLVGTASTLTLTTMSLSSVGLVVILLTRTARTRESVDADTGLPNMLGILADIAPHIADNHPIVIASIVFQGLDETREAIGHHAGSELLRRLVEDIGQVLPADSLIGRIDTDEIIAIRFLDDTLAQSQHPQKIVRAGERLAATLLGSLQSGNYSVGDVKVRLRPHIGLTGAPSEQIDAQELIRRASLSARRAARENVEQAWWDPDAWALTASDLRLLAELESAGSRGELWLAYQPQVDVDHNRPIGVEALIRWRHPQLGELGPNRFIPHAERTGLIDRLTEWVLKEALDAQVRWRAHGIQLSVSVNFSAQTLSREDLSTWVMRELNSRGLNPQCLTIEMTETTAANLGRAVQAIRPLHTAGVRISIDDFGTGYTSLASLRTLPVDELKLDLQFVQGSAVSTNDLAIAGAVGDLARRLDLCAVAEGIEDAQSAARMKSAGYHLFQGYYFAKPLSEDALLAYLATAATTPEKASP